MLFRFCQCRLRVLIIFCFCTVALYSGLSSAVELNGFQLDHGLIPAQQIHAGGPARDGIPAIDHPVLIKAEDATYIKDHDRVLGIVINGIAKAYPVKILNWHEVVNDAIEERRFTISYCPLCGTGVAFDRVVNGKELSFGVSGLLYNSDVLLYDRETQSLWSQLLSQSITGQYKGTVLKTLPILHTSWKAWKYLHPSSQVLSKKTGYWRRYNQNPYRSYESSRRLYFPVSSKAPEKYHPKEKVLGLVVGKVSKAYPFSELERFDKAEFTDTVNQQRFSIHWNKQSQSAYVNDAQGEPVPVVQSYWFAWYAFHPETELFAVD